MGKIGEIISDLHLDADSHARHHIGQGHIVRAGLRGAESGAFLGPYTIANAGQLGGDGEFERASDVVVGLILTVLSPVVSLVAGIDGAVEACNKHNY